MEYVKISNFLGGVVSRLINKGIESKLGIKPEIELRKFDLQTDEQESYVRVDVTAFMKKSDFEKLMEEVTK